MNRWQKLGFGLVAAACLTVGGIALVASVADDSGLAPAVDASASPTPTTDAPRATPTATPTPVAVDAKVAKQLAYVLAHWQKGTYNAAEYGIVTENDCVNFVSQALIVRGWEMDAEWSNPKTGSAYDATPAWVSSTALMRYIAASGRATALTDQQRDLVKVGDVVQFDWDNSGDRDHTGIVSKVEGSGPKRVISYAGHTEDTDYRTVDFAITERHPGGTAYYWSIP